MNLSQPYSVSIKNSFDMDSIQLTECATSFTLDTLCVGMYGGLDARVVQITSDFAGGNISNCKFMRSNAPGTTDHAVEITYCNNITINNSTFGITQFARSTGYPLSVSYSDSININNCTILNGPQIFIACSNSNIRNLNYCDRIIGYTNATGAQNAVTFDTKSSNCTFDGITYGYGVIPNCHPAGAIFRVSGGSTNSTARNLGTPSAPLNSGTWQCNLMNTANIFSTSGNNNTYRIQRAYVDNVRATIGGQINSDKNTVFDTVMKQNQYQLGTYAVDAPVAANLNCNMRGLGQVNATTGSASVYGLHWSNNYGMSRGRLVLHMNEPTTETISGYSVISGTPKFNSSGGVLMYNIGDSATWETFELKGITGFNDYEAPLMSGGTLSNHLLEYQIDTGSGYSEYKNLMRTKVVASGVSGQYTIMIADTSGLAVGDYLFGGTNLAYRAKITDINGTTITLSKPNRGTASGTVQFSQLPSEVCNPAYMKLKVKITTIVGNTAAITYLRLNTLTSWSALTTNLYPLENITISLPGINYPARVQIYNLNSSTELYNSFIDDNQFKVELPYVTDFVARVRIMPFNQSSNTACKFIEFEDYVYFDKGGLSRSIVLELDDVYKANNIDGSAITGISIDDNNLLVNIDREELTWAELYAYETYWLTTAEGIRDESRFITAVDTANYILENFKIKNIGTGPLVIIGGYGVDAYTGASITLLDITGNTIFSAPDHVVAYATGGSALTTAEHNQLMKTATKGDIWASAALGA